MKLLEGAFYAVGFVVIYLYSLVRANLYIAYDIVTPNMKINPGLIRVPITLHTNTGLLLFSNLLSMTPGTLSIDISRDNKEILVHVLYLDDEAAILAEMKDMQHKIGKFTQK